MLTRTITVRQVETVTDVGAAGRRITGSFLVEAVVAVFVSSLLALALGSMYVQVKRVGNMSQGQLIATALAQECVDHLRVMNWTAVQAMTPSTHYPKLFTDNAGDTLYPRALLQDPTLDYSNGGTAVVQAAKNTVFHSLNPDTNVPDDTVKVDLTSSGVSTQVTVTIRWLDTSGRKTYTLTSFVTDRGLGG